MSVPQNLGHLGQGSASAKQIRREREPKEVGTARRGMESGARQRSFDDCGDGLVRAEAANGRFDPNKQTPRRARWSPSPKIRGNRRADISRERKMLMARALASDDDLACLPVDVVQGHLHDLARAEAQSGEDQQDGEIALAGWSPLITLPEQASDFMWRQRRGHRGQSPIGHGEDRPGQVRASGHHGTAKTDRTIAAL
jgi:hypothetical protein